MDIKTSFGRLFGAKNDVLEAGRPYTQAEIEKLIEKKARELQMKEGDMIDLRALWEEPDGGGFLKEFGPIISIALTFITMMTVFFKK